MGRRNERTEWRRVLAALFGLALCCALPARAADAPAAPVTVEFIGGSLQAGTARVQARVVNGSARSLLGVRIAAYYDVLDALPADDASWRLHEFLLEPPLVPGAAADLEFTDPNAAEYVLLRLAYARLALAIAVDGGPPRPAQAELLEREGAQYIAARDLAAALGAKLTQDKDKRVTLGLPGEGPVLAYRGSGTQVALDGAARTLAHPVVEQEGRSWLPLHDVCALLGYEADYDLAQNVVELTRQRSA